MEDYLYSPETIALLMGNDTLVDKCAKQVANTTLHSVLVLIALVLAFKGLKHIRLSVIKSLAVHVLATSALILYFSSDPVIAFIIFNGFSIISLQMAKKKMFGYNVLAINIKLLIVTQLVCSYFDKDAFFLSIRGILMMHIMRLTTIAFRTQNDDRDLEHLPSFAGYIEYVYYPPLITFGPYLTYNQFNRMRNEQCTRVEDELGSLIKSVVIIFVAITLSIISTCHFDVFIPSSQFVEDALTAMSYRFSHYFVCFFGYAILVFLGSDVTVTDPLQIEFPRSMLDIVATWNKPFHTFLHKYVFEMRYFNTLILNVFLTFAVSALLHGLDSQMAMTLFALGFIAYSETVFRKRLASRFSMCVAAKPCKSRANRLICGHRYTSSSGRCLLVNLFFTVLSMYHLVFTGMTFTDDYAGTGYPLNHTLFIWGTHHYASLIISLSFLLLSKII